VNLRRIFWLTLALSVCAATAFGQGTAPETAPPLFPGGGLVSYNSVFTTRAPTGIPATARPTFSQERDFNFTWGFYRDFDLTILVPLVTNILRGRPKDSYPTNRLEGRNWNPATCNIATRLRFN